jgi:hypothetical protein
MDSGRIIKTRPTLKTPNALLHQVLQARAKNLCGLPPHTALEVNIQKNLI